MRKFSFVLMLTAFAMCMASHAQAQFWHNWFHKKEEKRKPRPHKPVNATDEPVAVTKSKKKREVTYPDTKIKKRYRIDILAPLYLDELVNGDYVTYKDKMPDKAVPSLDFYEGMCIAIDTMNKYLFNVDVYIHDITIFAESPEQLVSTGKLDSSDLIIGAVQSHDIPVVAAFAKKIHVNFISAISPSDAGVKDDPYFTLMQPSLQIHCDALQRAIDKKYHGQTITLLYRTVSKPDENAYGLITKDTVRGTKYQKLLCNALPSYRKLLPLFDSQRTNVVLVPILDNSFADSLLKLLYNNFPSYHFEVYGMPTWKSISSLHKVDAYPNCGVNITAPSYYDVSTGVGQYVEGKYKREYGGRPGEMVYMGYENMYWYTNLLLQYGTIFNKRYTENGSGPFTHFEIAPIWDRDDNLLYYENKHVYLYRYQSGSFITEQQ